MADTWTAISGYTPQDYTDTAVFEVNPDTKKIALITGQALVAGEENSQYIKFVLDRYWDGIDIKDKAFYVEYALAGTYYGKTAAVNAEYNTEQVRFGWIVPKEACCISGTLLFVLRIESADYVLKTQIAEHPVFKSVNVEDVVPEPTKEAWYREFEARAETAIDDAEAALTAAQAAQTAAENAALNAQTSEENAETAAATAQTRYGSPLVAQTAEEMVEQNRVYVYTGSETGYTAGHWYYHNGTEWVDGGVYNGSAVNTDTTLTQSGMAADAKAVGDELSTIKEDLNNKLNVTEIEFTHGAYIKTDGSTVDVNSPVANASYRYAVVPCKEGDWVEINVDGAGAARAYSFVDSNGNKIYGTASNVVIRGTVRVPANTAYLVLNCKASAEYVPSYKGLLNNYAVESLQIKTDAETASINNQKYTPKGELSRISLSAATQVVAFLHNATNRVSPVPDSFIYIKKGTRVYINDSTTTAQFFLLEKDLDGVLTAGQWRTEYIATKDVYAIPCLRYSDDSDIADADALAKLLTIDFGYREDDIPMWRNQWFVDGSHRGYMEEAPESTLAAFVRAKVHGYNTCECDLRKTSDGHFVVHHNTSMPSNSSYYIYLHTLDELRANANMGTYNGITQQILEFKDLLQLMKQLDMKLFVELKFASGSEGSKFTAQDIADLIDTVKDLGMQDRVIWMGSVDSTDHAYAQRFRNADADCYLAIFDSVTVSDVQPYVISGKPERTIVYARTTYITESVVQNLASIGVNVMAWAVTFSWLYPDWTEEQIKAEIRRCLSCGVVGMVLDKWTVSELVRDEYADYL